MSTETSKPLQGGRYEINENHERVLVEETKPANEEVAQTSDQDVQPAKPAVVKKQNR